MTNNNLLMISAPRAENSFLRQIKSEYQSQWKAHQSLICRYEAGEISFDILRASAKLLKYLKATYLVEREALQVRRT